MEELILITIQTERIIPLPCDVKDIKGLTVNRCVFFFLDCSGYNLIKWSKCNGTIEIFALDRQYLCICYDHVENCYWGISECEPCRIYRLDAHFCEVGHISIDGDSRSCAIGICCDDCADGFWVCYPCQLAFVSKCGSKVTWHENEDAKKTNLGVLMQCECRVNCFDLDGTQSLEVQSPYCSESIELCIPEEHKFVSIASCFCEQKGDCHFFVLLSKDCSDEFVLGEYCVNFSQQPAESGCPCHPEPDPCPYPCPPDPNCGVNYEVIHSIALEEAGLAHILNAEGEKIQKAVAISDNIEQLICVNESVKRTLTQVTLLEGMLYSKLEVLIGCDSCCHINPPCPTPCPPIPCCDCEDCCASDCCQ